MAVLSGCRMIAGGTGFSSVCAPATGVAMLLAGVVVIVTGADGAVSPEATRSRSATRWARSSRL
ncbi:MAG: hypothetical protein Q8L63_04040 [Alphaproteobacteria bacterium]|nr:hypothetical protein [Alphaproteobacteria bacterium]